MNISEAGAVNTLLRWATKTPRDGGGLVPDQQALDAAMLLADRAHKALGAGWSGAEVNAHWPALELAVPAKLTKKGKVVCGRCGSKTFRYDEGHPSARRMESNEDGILAFYSDFEWFDGDDDPGVVCDACDTPAELPDGVEIGWR